MTRDELLDALVAERYNGGGWRTPAPEQERDDDLMCARRRRLMVADFERVRDGKEASA